MIEELLSRAERLTVGTIVVGVDGSPGAELALRFAAGEAKLRGADLRVVTAWHVPTMAYSGGFAAAAIDPTEFEKSARAGLEQTVRALADELTGLKVEQVVELGQPAELLVEQAKGADLLVVGTRGHGGFAGLLLGSVSQQCAHHAPCPVVIVRGEAK
jgi:nucleotide-binding universal stress UspA family protein